ncbi:phage major capsid protein [Gemmata sp. G18]|uniref:Phage major capsid protein n=1 Tax=Gemmata palustris TaxID=2822762 RepID=A0ABS5BMI1_9BACT|nr:phage major capsid protein [Gemmata palustris]MBP3954916.1 phage major capsid protein [Gemmata palustris]
MAKQFRASEEVSALIAQVQGQVDAIKSKWDSAEPTPEDVSKMNELVSQLETLAQEQQLATAEERLQKFRASQEEPSRPAPKFTVPAQAKKVLTPGELFHSALRHGFRDPIDNETQYRMKRAGYDIGSNVTFKTDFSLINSKKRKQYRTLSKGANPGNDLVFENYSNNVVEIMALQSPLLSVLNIESTDNGNPTTYFTLDDSANESTDITASGGSELSPTIPDKDVSDGKKKCGIFTITSGYQKVTRQELSDSYVKLEGDFQRWSATRHALKLERDIVLGNGNGETGREGLLSCDTTVTPISGGAWTYAGLKNFIVGFDTRYRADIVLLVSEATYAEMAADLVDENERSYFDINIQNDQEYTTFFGKKIFVSKYMSDGMVLGFDPNYFVVRTKDTQSFDVLKEKFYPLLGYCGLMDFGCMGNFPTGACKSIALTS